jgi:hypothetical protein
MLNPVALVALGALLIVALTYAGLKLDPYNPDLGSGMGAAFGALVCMSVQFGWPHTKK